MLKDMLLAQAAAQATGAATPLGAHAASIYQAIADAGEARKDFSVVFRWLGDQERGKVLT
jgi:3-hydroxyisobutyrate dehydrogenase